MTLTTDVDTFLRLCPTALPANSGFLVTCHGGVRGPMEMGIYVLICINFYCTGLPLVAGIQVCLFFFLILFFPLENSEMQPFGKMNKAPPNFEEYRGQGKNILGDAMNHRCL